MIALEDQFHQAMVQIYHDIVRAGINYRPIRFLQMVERYGGREAARRLLQDPILAYGFERLWEAGRLDLSVEHLALQEPWRQLFCPEDLAEAERRLAVDQ